MYSLTGFIAETGGLSHTKPLPSASGRPTRWPAPACADAQPARGASPCNGAPCSRHSPWRGVLPLARRLRWRAPAPTTTPWRDVLDTPAQKSPLAARGLLTGLARAGKRSSRSASAATCCLSDDAGKTWQQADVPVSSDLVAVHFPDAERGWAVGHDGVVLNSTDGGRTWTRQLDGRDLGDALVAYYSRSGDAKWLAEAQRFAAQGAENPFLDVWFEDDTHRLRRRRLRPGAAHRRRRQDAGSRWCTRPTTRRACTCTPCAASAASCSSSASRAWC